ncbi:MAG: LuxR C-terminal-related transcriptional regulator [Chloroflexota bacterium]
MTSEGLSEREIEILKLVSTGVSNKEIASRLSISTNTVKVHIRNIFTKINVNSRTEAAIYAINAGLISVSAAGPIADLEHEKEDSKSPIDAPETEAEPRPGPSELPKARRWVLLGLGAAVVALLAMALFVIIRRQALQQTAVPQASASAAWIELPPLPTARYNLGAAATNEMLYAIGGMDEDGPTGVLEIYNLKTQQWSVGPEKPTPVGDIGASVVRGKILVPGGRLTTGAVSRVLEIYDPRSSAWSAGAELPDGLAGYAFTVYEGRVYLFGGWDGNRYTDLALMYDIETNRWDRLPPMPTARGYASAAAAGGKIYVMGGTDGNHSLAVNEVFDPNLVQETTDVWSQAAALPLELQEQASAEIADMVYLFGGSQPAGQNDRNYIYNPLQDSWSVFEADRQSIGAGVRVLSLGSSFYALGGRSGQQPMHTHLMYQAFYTLSFPVIIK